MTTTLLDRLDTDIRFDEIVDALSRRGFLGGIAGTAALAGLAACGANDNKSSSSSTTTRKVDTIHGKVAVPAEPKRIVPFDFPGACTLLDLGVTPVGRPGYMPAFPAYTRALKGVPAIANTDGDLLIEKIAALTPELIVGDDWADPSKQQVPYAKLSAIAPTAIFAWEQAAGNWPDLAAQTATAIGRDADLRKLRDGVKAQSEQITATWAALLSSTRWDVIDAFKDGWDLYSASSSHGRVLTDAGVRLGAGASQEEGYKQYSLERFGILSDSDVIVTTPTSLPVLKAQRAFTTLPAAKAGRVFTTDLFFPASYGIAGGLLADLDSICRKVKTA